MKYYNVEPVDRRNLFFKQRQGNIVGKKIDIVQFGDSITQGFNISRYYPTNKVIINSGIPGDITDIMVERFEEHCISYNPKVVILMAGINDVRLFNNGQSYNKKINSQELLVEHVSTNIIKMIEMCTCKVLWCKTLPTAEEDISSWYVNSIVEKINDAIESHISEKDNVEVIVFENMVAHDGRLNKNMSMDDLHPNDDGYLGMVKYLEHVL